MNKSPRLLLNLTILIVAVFLAVLQIQRLLSDRTILPPDDFVEYYAAGQLNAHGKNPYDPNQLKPIEIAAGRDTDEAIMMWNPPWTLTLGMPFGLMDSRLAQILWLLLGFGFIVAGADLLWRIYGGPVELRWIAWLLAFTYLPTFFVLSSGQIGTWVLAGAVLFLYFQKRGRPMLAGAAAVLLAIKPHLVYLFWIALIVRGAFRDRRLLLGGLLTGIVTAAIPLIANPNVFSQYWEAMTQRSPANWKSPTFGTLIRMAMGESQFGLTFLPTLVGLGWLLWNAWSVKREAWSVNDGRPALQESAFRAPRFEMLLLVSFVTSSYGAWPFDLIILLPAVIQVAATIVESRDSRLIWRGIGCWLALNLAALLLNFLKVGSFWFIWMAPVMLAMYLDLMNYRKTDHA